jgi:hypothetical protein
VIIDAVREVRPKFSPADVVAEFSSLLKSYRLTEVQADRYAGAWPQEAFRKHNVRLRYANKTTSELFREFLAPLNTGLIALPDNQRLVSQLAGLERRASRAGRETISHPPGGHDDIACAVAGACYAATSDGRRGRTSVGYCVDGAAGRVVWDDDERPGGALGAGKHQVARAGGEYWQTGGLLMQRKKRW